MAFCIWQDAVSVVYQFRYCLEGWWHTDKVFHTGLNARDWPITNYSVPVWHTNPNKDVMISNAAGHKVQMWSSDTCVVLSVGGQRTLMMVFAIII